MIMRLLQPFRRFKKGLLFGSKMGSPDFFPPACAEERQALISQHPLPIPPDALCIRVGGTKGDEFISQGKYMWECLIRCLPIEFSYSGKRVLDFGCGIGRVLRHFASDAGKTEFWGTDIDEPSVRWLARHTSGIFGLATVESSPGLRFPANYFDFIYCISVFTHIHENWDVWLEEIARVLAPGGIFLSTFHGRTAYEWILQKHFDEKTVGMEIHGKDRPWDIGGPMVFHSDGWVIEHWSKFLPVQYIITDGMIHFQNVAVMRKGGTSKSREQIKILQPFTYSPRSADFFGNVEYDPLGSEPWLVECGLISGNSAQFTGWFVSAAGPVVQIDFCVDQRKTPARVVRQERPDVLEAYPTIPRSRNSPPGFQATLDLSGFDPGAHQAVATALDSAGRKYCIDFMIFKRIQ